MKHTVRVVARSPVATGFAMAGARVVEVETPAEAAREVTNMREQGDVGVVLVENSLYRELPDEVRRGRRHRPVPIVVPFPGPRWEEGGEAEQYVIEMLRRAIGYRVRMR